MRKGTLFLGLLATVAPAAQQAGATYESADWKADIAAGRVPYRRVTLDDYPIRDADHPDTGMYTEGFVAVTYKAAWDEHRIPAQAWVTSWTVRSGLNKNRTSRRSWFTDMDKMLPHEQGHLDINEIYARALAKRGLADLPEGQGRTGPDAMKDLDRKLGQMVDTILAGNRAEQLRYDKETVSGTDPDKQAQWSRSIQDRLTKAGISR